VGNKKLIIWKKKCKKGSKNANTDYIKGNQVIYVLSKILLKVYQEVYHNNKATNKATI